MQKWDVIIFIAQVVLQEPPASTGRNGLKQDILEVPGLHSHLLDHEFVIESKHVIWVVLIQRNSLEFLQKEVPVQTIELKRDIFWQENSLKVK